MGFSLFRAVLQSHRGAGRHLGRSFSHSEGRGVINENRGSGEEHVGFDWPSQWGRDCGTGRPLVPAETSVGSGQAMSPALLFASAQTHHMAPGLWVERAATPVPAVRMQSLTCAGFPGWAPGWGRGGGREEGVP